MYDFKIEAADTPTLYRDLASALEGLIAGEPDAVANMANAAALIWESLPDVNWVGFYRNVGGELVVGPFQGRPACIRIPFGTGVCGAAAATLEIQRIDDVHAFPGHIACDAASASEIVVPIVRGGELIAVLDIDSPTKGRFSEEDEAFRREIAGWLAEQLEGEFRSVRGRGGAGDEHALFDERLAWERRLAAAGWTCVAWPKEHGGRGLPFTQQVIFYEEYARAGGPGRVGHIGETLGLRASNRMPSWAT